MTSRHRYAELHAHSAYSFLDGANEPDELASAAVELALRAATTDGAGAPLPDWDADEQTARISSACARQGVWAVRVHDVARNARAVRSALTGPAYGGECL